MSEVRKKGRACELKRRNIEFFFVLFPLFSTVGIGFFVCYFFISVLQGEWVKGERKGNFVKRRIMMLFYNFFYFLKDKDFSFITFIISVLEGYEWAKGGRNERDCELWRNMMLFSIIFFIFYCRNRKFWYYIYLSLKGYVWVKGERKGGRLCIKNKEIWCFFFNFLYFLLKE